MRRKVRKKSSKFYAIILAVIALSLGYAFLSSDLNILGTAGINKHTWDVHWDDTSIRESGNVTATTPAYVSDTKKKIVTFGVELGIPGEYYEFTADAKNYGDVDAIVKNINVGFYEADGETPTTISNCLQYSLTHADGTEIKADETIEATQSKKYKFRIEFKDFDAMPETCTSSPIIGIKFDVSQPTPGKNKIIFNPNGGVSSETAKYINKGSAIGDLPTATKDGVEFAGWYTGLTTGTKINAATVPSGSTTYYAHWKEVLPIFDTGENVIKKFKTLAGDTLSGTNPQTTVDTNITAIRKSATEPTEANKTEEHIVSSENSTAPIYAWYDNGTIYWWTNASSAYLNEDASYMFCGLNNLTTLETANFNTMSTEDMSYMFAGTTISTIDLSGFDTSGVTNMSYMFASTNIPTLDLSGFNTGSVTNMSYMFAGAQTPEVDLHTFDVSQVTTIYSLFAGSQVEDINISGWNFASTNDLSGLFSSSSKLKTLDLSNVNTSNIEHMSGMFSGCSSIEILDLSSFDISNVVNIYMFGGNSSLKSLNISGWNFASLTGISGLFGGFTALETINLTDVNTSNIMYMSGMFSGDTSLKTLDLTSFDTSKVVSMDSMFSGCTGLTTITVSDDFVVDQVTSSSDMFSGCTVLVGGAGTPWNNSYIDKTRAHYDYGDMNPGYFNMAEGLTTYTVTFNPNGGTVNPTTKTVVEGSRIKTLPTPTYEGKLFKGWFTEIDGGIEVNERKVIDKNVTFYAHWYTEKDITYDANGGTFTNNETTNEINYEYKQMTITKYSHTANINDEGIATGTYSGNLKTTDIVTIPGASQITIDVWYSTENSNYYDWLAIYPAGVEPTYYNYNQATISNGKLYGGQYTSKPGDDTVYHKTYTVQGNTAQFYFQSNNSNSYYGYYAVISGVGYDYDKDNTYKQPTQQNNKFLGWNTQANGNGKRYTSEQEIIDDFDNLSDNATLYAEWVEQCTVTFNPNGGILQWYSQVTYDKGAELDYEPPTFKTGSAFQGWFTGETDGIQVDRHYIVDHTQTLYAHWSEVGAKFDTGKNVNAKFKILAGDTVDDSYPYTKYPVEDTNITAIKRATTAPDITTLTADENIVSVPDQGTPIYAWFDDSDGTIYWWTEADVAYLNEDPSYMFTNFKGATYIDTSFNTSLATTLYYMFAYDTALTEIDVSNFITNGVTDMSYVFYGAGMTSLDLSSWNTSNATTMASIIGYMPSIESVDMSNFDFNKYNPGSLLNNLTGYSSSSLKVIKFDNSKLPENIKNFASSNYNIEEISLRNADTSRSTSMYYMFASSNKLKKIDLTGVDTSNVTDMSYMFYECKALESIDVSSFNTSKVTNMLDMFYNCDTLTSLDLSSFDVRKVTNLKYVAGYCDNLEELNLSNWKLDSINHKIYNIFSDSQNIKTLIMNNARFPEDMSLAFYNLENAEEILLENADTSRVSNMNNAFEDCENVKELELGSFDTSNVTDMGGMFYNCKKLERIYVSDDFVVDQVTSHSNMFYNTEVLEGGAGTHWDENHITKERAHYDGGINYPGYFQKSTVRFNVTLNPNGGSMLNKKYKVTEGTTIGLVEEPKYKDHVFDGWHLGTPDGQPIDTLEYIPNTNITLVATWRETRQVTVTFNPNGGQVDETSRTMMEGEILGRLPIPTKQGGVFTGWHIGVPEGMEVDRFYTPVGNVTLWASWSVCGDFATASWDTIVENVKNDPQTYPVGCTKDVTLENYGTHTVRVANNTKQSECSNKNYSQTSCGFVLEFIDVITNYKINSNTSSYGGWPNSEVRTFVNENIYNSLPIDLRNKIGTTYVVSGYDAADISNSSSGRIENLYTSKDKLYLPSTTEVIGTSPAMLQTLKYYYNDMVNKRQYIDDYYNTSGEEVIFLYDIYAAIKTNQFDYYRINGVPRKTDANNIDEIAMKKYNNIATAWWTRTPGRKSPGIYHNIDEEGGSTLDRADEQLGISPAFRLGESTYTVKFNPNGGTVTPTSKEVDNGKEVGELPIPSRSGYSFDGWYTIDDLRINANYIPAANITVFAHWTKNDSEPEDFSTDSWETIGEAAKDGTACDVYHVGDEKTVNMGTFGTHTVRIANCSTPAVCSDPNFSQTACGVVLEVTDIVGTRPMNELNGEYNVNSFGRGNQGSWPASEVRRYLNSTFYNQLPQGLRNIIIDTYTVSGKGEFDSSASPEVKEQYWVNQKEPTSYDRIYISTVKEILGIDLTKHYTSYKDTSGKYNRQLDYYTQQGVVFTQGNENGDGMPSDVFIEPGITSEGSEYLSKTEIPETIKTYNGEPTDYWTRSAGLASHDAFFTIRSTGKYSWESGGYSFYAKGLAPLFRIG